MYDVIEHFRLYVRNLEQYRIQYNSIYMHIHICVHLLNYLYEYGARRRSVARNQQITSHNYENFKST